jgi:hypothetical protein
MKLSEKHKKIYKAIDEILWNDWDPIGINDIEEVRDEYQSYTPHIFNLTIQGANKTKLSNHLFEIETKNMGMTGNLNHCQVIADKIIKLIK